MQYHKTLELNLDATSDEIKQAYRRLAMKWHPDRNKSKDAEERFKEISVAYEKLSDPYFRYPLAPKKYTPPKNVYTPPEPVAIPDFTATVSLLNVFTGTNYNYRKQSICSECNGTGQRDIFKGTIGETVWGYKNRYGNNSNDKDEKNKNCHRCSGKGEIITVNITVNVPKGVADGDVLKLQCTNNISNHRSGLMNVKIKVEPHQYFDRKGNDLYYRYQVIIDKNNTEREAKIKSLDGTDVVITIPDGIEDGKMLRLTNYGLLGLNGNRGHVYVTVKHRQQYQ